MRGVRRRVESGAVRVPSSSARLFPRYLGKSLLSAEVLVVDHSRKIIGIELHKVPRAWEPHQG